MFGGLETRPTNAMKGGNPLPPMSLGIRQVGNPNYKYLCHQLRSGAWELPG